LVLKGILDMKDLEKLKEKLISEILIYLENYTDLHPDDLFALRIDLPDIITDSIDDLVKK
jgi:hypothetical protein